MDQSHFNTIEDIRKSGSHLSLEERGMIQALHRQGYLLRAIAAEVGCAHTTVFYEPKRERRKESRKPCMIDHDNCEPFIQWMTSQVRKER